MGRTRKLQRACRRRFNCRYPVQNKVTLRATVERDASIRFVNRSRDPDNLRARVKGLRARNARRLLKSKYLNTHSVSKLQDGHFSSLQVIKLGT